MEKNSTGVWSVVSGVLPPDIYTYQFSIDGALVPDGANPRLSQGASELFVPGAPWSGADVPHGAVAKHTYASSIIGGGETFYVYTPPGYDPKRREAYPVLYVLHGLGDDASKWIEHGGANETLDSLIAAGKAKPMILVSPAGYGNVGGNAAQGFPAFSRALLEEIKPMVQQQYNAATTPAGNAITGLSMGGGQSLLMLNHLDQFAWVGSFSPGFDMYSPDWGKPRLPGAPPAVVDGQRPVLAEGIAATLFPTLNAESSRRLRLLYIVCGTTDDHLDLTRQFRNFLGSRGVMVNYKEVAGAGHLWSLWRAELAEMAPLLFR